MIPERHFNSALFSRLLSYVNTGDFSGLTSYLETLSHSLFRTAGYMLGERIMAQSEPAVFWTLFIHLNRYDNKAFLVTTTKAFIQRLHQGDVSLHDQAFADFSVWIQEHDVDRQKFLRLILPEVKQVDDLRYLFGALGLREALSWLPYLLDCPTLPASYLLFSSLRHLEHDVPRLERIAYALIRRGDTLSFNLASLMKAYFGLEHVKGTFSLQLKPFQLSRLELSYEAFCQAVSF